MAISTESYFGHDADIGIIGRGPTAEAAFEQAASAMFAIMADPAGVRAEHRIHVEFDEDDRELALVRWLNALIAAAQEGGLALSRFHLVREGTRWQGEAWGEPWRDDLDRGVEVKGATLTALRVGQRDGAWEARCVVDV